MDIVVSGSLAYDRIMNFPGHFADHILPEKIHVLNVAFQVDGVTERFGGTAGNIAYALTLMGEKPLISAAIGKDYQPYFDWFRRNGIGTGGIRIVGDELTASAYITTDRADNQITGFNPGAMRHSSTLDFDAFDPGGTLVIVSPGNLSDMVHYPLRCKERGIDYIFDPGQALPMLAADDLARCIEGARILIVNDYELELVLAKMGLSKTELLKLPKALITTLGEKGSEVSFAGREMRIPAASPEQVLDPTGAGDSYRGGLLCGLVRGKDLLECARMGSVCASFSVECVGTQEYRFTPDQFGRRLGG
jgi:adenosine kinase